MPLVITIYFLAGLSSFSAIAQLFYTRDHLTLDPTQLMRLAAWITLPWASKLLLGSIVDNYRIFGSNRKAYIVLGTGLMALAELLYYVFYAHPTGELRHVLGEYHSLLLAGLTYTVGFVLCDLIADTLVVELTDDVGTRARYQVWSSISQASGGLIAALLSGCIRQFLSMADVSLIRLLFPLAILLAVYFHTSPAVAAVSTPITRDRRPLLLGLFLLSLCIFTQSQLIIFCAQLLILSYLFTTLRQYMDKGSWIQFILPTISIFLFRLTPGYGPGYDWWTTTALGFTDAVLGQIRIASAIAGLVMLYLLRNKFTTSNIRGSLAILNVGLLLTCIPPLLVYYGHMLGISPRMWLLVDTGVGSALAGLSMLPLGILVAQYAPSHMRATYMALTAALANLSLLGADLITQWMNEIYIVTRTDFSKLGSLMLLTLYLSTALVLTALGLMYVRSRHVK